MLLCPICQVRMLTDKRSQDLTTKWQHRRGDPWYSRDNDAPYWFCCVTCHMWRWPNDERYATGASRPAPSRLGRELSGRHRLFEVDLWLTALPPERASLLAVTLLSFKIQMQTQRRRVRVAATAASTAGGGCFPNTRRRATQTAPRIGSIVAVFACNCYGPPRRQFAEWKHVATDAGPHEMPADKFIKTHTNYTNQIQTTIQTALKTYTNYTNRKIGQKEIITSFIFLQFV